MALTYYRKAGIKNEWKEYEHKGRREKGGKELRKRDEQVVHPILEGLTPAPILSGYHTSEGGKSLKREQRTRSLGKGVRVSLGEGRNI